MRVDFGLWGLAAQLPLSSSVMVNHDHFTPQDLVSLDRPSAAVPNAAGDLAFVTISRYDLESKKNNKFLVLVPLQSNFDTTETPLPKGGEFFWLTGTTLAHVVEGENNLEIYSVPIYSSHSHDESSSSTFTIALDRQFIGTIPTKTATNFRYNPASRHLVFSDYVFEDGNLTNVKKQDEVYENRGNSAFVYDNTYVRHWDTWVGPKKPALFSVRLVQDPDRKWGYGNEFFSPLKGTNHHCPVEPFGGTDDFDVSSSHIVYTTKDPQLPEAWHTKQNVYIVDIKGEHPPRELTSGKQGATHSPVFNHQGTKVAWLELDEDGYESDRAKIVVYDLEVDVRYTLTQRWDRSPDSIAFNPEGTFIYFTVGDEARVKISYLPLPPTPSESSTDPELDSLFTSPVEISSTGAASNIYPLHTGRLLFSKSTLVSPNDAFLIQRLPRYITDLSSNSTDADTTRGKIEQLTRFTGGKLKNKGLSQGEEIWFEGALGKRIQGWVLKPRGWSESDGEKKWPVAFLIHGGPQGAWEDQWSTRWNPNVFTGHGYFVILINPTGSTTFGQELTDAIKEDWGGKPFVDLINGYKFALEKYPEIDADRAVAAGASWGGYAINWIQGHPEFGFNFKALVAHDGVFDSQYNGFSTDELFFFNHEWGGRPWDAKSKNLSTLFSPSNFVDKWSTPQLLIHGSKDFRLPETESIGAFHALQQLGIPSRLVVFPDENHWVLNHGNSLKWHEEVFNWFERFTGKNDGNEKLEN